MQMKDFTIAVQMLVWRPVAEVFNAFIDPSITSKFWFTRSSGPLEEGKTVIWEWEINDASALVKVDEIIINKLIRLNWEHPIPIVEIEFITYGDQATLVIIRNFTVNLVVGEIVDEIVECTSNLTSVLDGLKAYLEHDTNLNLIRDKLQYA